MTQLQLQYQQNKLREQELAETVRANKAKEGFEARKTHVEEFLAPYKAADLDRSVVQRESTRFKNVGETLVKIFSPISAAIAH